MWTWLAGNSTGDSLGSYEVQGVSSALSYPGARSGHSLIFHEGMNALLLFGGYGYDADGNGEFKVMVALCTLYRYFFQ